MTCEYKIVPEAEDPITAVETSVIWITEGKGSEDIGVHFFERRMQDSPAVQTFQEPQHLSTLLPSSPLSYEGEILKIKWCVRVRIFLQSGEQITEDRHFRLGNVAPFAQNPANESEIETTRHSEDGKPA